MIDPIEDKRMWEESLREQRKNDPFMRLAQKAIDLGTNTQFIIENPHGINIEELKKMMNQPLKIMVSEPFEIEHLKLKEELAAAAKYIEENEVIHKKSKKDIPTVIEYQGRRYVLDNGKR